MNKRYRRAGLYPAIILSITLAARTFVYGAASDYHPVTGEPRCFNCHTPDRHYSIDYTRDSTCVECHGPGLSGKYLSIDGRHREQVALNAAQPGKHGNAGEKGDTEAKKKIRPNTRMTVQNSREMALVGAGEFTMGANDWWPKSQPEHKRVLPAFYMDKYEVTNLRYKEFVDATGRPAPDHWTGGRIPAGRENHPVVFVSWNDADAFCRWDGGKRLPTEAEWEKAARGTDKRTFPWGDKFSRYKANTPQLGLEDTMPVGSFEDGKSPYGIYDMAGNVWEWTEDWFKPYPGNTHPDENYGEKYKVLRGGSWYDCTYYKCGISAPAYNKIFFNPGTKNNNFGFRCVKDR